MRVLSKIVVMAAASATVMSLGLAPALADPPSGTTPALTDVVGVGSDTTTGVLDAIAKTYDATSPANKLYSFDALNPVTGAQGDNIITKGTSGSDTTCQIARPDGSGAGITALNGTATDGGHPCIDFSRSSSPPGASTPTGLVFVPFGEDAVSWTTPSAGSGKATTLSQSQLKKIYLCTDTTWASVGGTSTATITPVLPQSGSGTRAFFLAAIGVTTPGSCVVNGTINIPGNPNNPVVMEENTGASQKRNGQYLTGNAYEFANVPNAVYPYSAADWIAQGAAPAGGAHNTSSFGHGSLKEPQKIYNASAILTHSGAISTINPNFSATFDRLVYNVMPNAGTTSAPKIPSGALTTIFGNGGAVCSDTSDIKSYGFLTIGSDCGVPISG